MAAGSNKSTGIIPRAYKSGSIIYFDGDKSENIYILKSGRVILTSTKLDTGEETKEEVRLGEFFGVKSSLGKYPREETAQTIGETIVLILKLVDFERLILRNVKVVRKMLTVFSNQLRRIHKMVRSVLGEGDNLDPDVELFRIGEYYYKNGVLKQAEYAFKRYMEYYPDSENASIAMKRIQAIASGQAVPEDVENEVISSEDDLSVDDFEDDTGEDADSNSLADGNDFDSEFDLEGGSETQSSLSDEMDDFLSDDSEPDNL